MGKKQKGVKAFIKKTKNQILLVSVSLLFFYLLLLLLPLSVKNVLFLTYKQNEISKASRQKYQLFGKLADFYASSSRDTDVYGRKIVIRSGINNAEEPVVSSRGADDKFNSPDDMDIRKIVRKTIKEIAKAQDYSLRPCWHVADNQLYSVMYRFWQEYFPLATIEIPNNPAVRNVRVSLSMGGYGGKILESCEKFGTSIIKIMPEFSIEKLSGLTTPQEVVCSIKMEYELYGVKKSTETFQKLTIHPFNDFTWSNPEILACFITPADEAIAETARTSVNLFTGPAANSNLGKTGILFYASKFFLDGKNTSVRENQCLFPRQCLFKNELSSVTVPAFFSSLVMSQGVDANLAVLSEKKEVFAMVRVEKIKVQTEKGGLPEALVDKAAYWIPNVLGSHKFIKETLCPEKETFSRKLNSCYISYNGQEYLALDLRQNSFLDACKSGLNFKRYLIDGKLTVVDIEKARVSGYVPPDGIERIFSVGTEKTLSMRQIEEKGGSELKDILKSEVIYE